MPRLQSGRLVGLCVEDLCDRIVVDGNGELVSLRMGFRPEVDTLEALAGVMKVVYVPPGGSVPDDAYDSGFTLNDICAGKAGWTPEEIAEFRAWIAGNEALQENLASMFVAIKLQEIGEKLDSEDA